MSPCRYCVAPKRYAGCKANCPEYLEWLPGELERKEAIKRSKAKDISHRKKYIEKFRKNK